jgi:cytochrome c biogenesis protein
LPKQKNPFWSFFTSIYLTITLLVLTVILSIVGTFIPQQDAAREFTQGIAPGLASFLQTMQAFDVFHSVWFFLLMLLLSLNLIVCSLNRWPLTWKQFRGAPIAEEEGLFRGLSPERIFMCDEDVGTTTGRMEVLLSRKYRKIIRNQEKEDAAIIYGEKGRYSRFAVYAVHVSLLFLIMGALAGSFWGWEGYVNIGEGETADAIDLKGAKGTKKLPFTIRCDKFLVAFYENGAPKTFRSDLTFLKDGKTLFQGPLLVNHPISLEGVRIYQASYGNSPDGRASLAFTRRGGEEKLIKVGPGEIISLPEKNGTVQIARIEENLMKMGPAVKIIVHSGEGEVSFWVFQHIDKIREMNPGVTEQVPMFNPALFKPYVFVLKGIEERHYTGLQISRDPGAPLVAAAAVFMIMGLIGTFFSSHRRIWIKIQRAGEKTKISVAARTNKHRVVLDREVRQLTEQIKISLETGST